MSWKSWRSRISVTSCVGAIKSSLSPTRRASFGDKLCYAKLTLADPFRHSSFRLTFSLLFKSSASCLRGIVAGFCHPSRGKGIGGRGHQVEIPLSKNEDFCRNRENRWKWPNQCVKRLFRASSVDSNGVREVGFLTVVNKAPSALFSKIGPANLKNLSSGN